MGVVIGARVGVGVGVGVKEEKMELDERHYSKIRVDMDWRCEWVGGWWCKWSRECRWNRGVSGVAIGGLSGMGAVVWVGV